jgi:hypothetical protein
MDVVPLSSPVAKPPEVMEATVGLELTHVMAAPETGLPLSSSIDAENCWVRPRASMLTLPGVMTILEGRGAEVESPPHPKKSGKRRRRPRAGSLDFIWRSLDRRGTGRPYSCVEHRTTRRSRHTRTPL